MPNVRISSGKQFVVMPDETILDGALRCKVTLPHSCRTGRCGTCRAVVRCGSTEAGIDELGLTDAERSSDCILTCVRSAKSDLELEIGDLGDFVLPSPRTLPCRIHTLERFSEDVLRVALRLPPHCVFDYLPGQYINLIGQGGIRRSYSIANSFAVDNYVELHVSRVPGGVMSAYWFDAAKTNDLLRLYGPLGTFFMREVDELDVVYLATGTGIAPIKAMIDALARAGNCQARSLSVFWGGRVPRDLYCAQALERSVTNFVPVLSRADSTWSGARGYVHKVLLEKPREWNRLMVYASGSDAMIHDARKVLCAAGLPEGRFYSDAFVSSGSA